MIQAPDLEVSQWFNTTSPIQLSALRGQVVVMHAFQMLCPGCVQQAIPQLKRVHEQHQKSRLRVLALHTVFEHHNVMGPEALEVFIHENKLSFPIGVDRPGSGAIPVTMERYQMRGTPTLILLDKAGRQRFHHFGSVDDLVLGTAIGQLLAEPADADY